MPKKRKVDETAVEGNESVNPCDVEVKTEILSQDEAKNGLSGNEEKSTGNRNLRPRKSTSYVDKESPEPVDEEKPKKGRRKRRTSPSCEEATGPNEKLSKGRRTAKDAVSSDPKELVIDANIVPKVEPVSPGAEGTTEARTTPSAEGEPTEKAKSKKRPRGKKRVAEAAAEETAAAAETSGDEEDKDGKETETAAAATGNGEKVKKRRKRARVVAPPDCDIIKVENLDGENETLEEGQKAEESVKKRPRNRAKAKKAAGTDVTGGEDDINSKEDDKAGGENAEGPVGAEESDQTKPVGQPARKTFFRGRRSKSMSARAGKKEIHHEVEPINPEDIKGFEHVETYSAPEGLLLPKFWDSEDEVSEDETNDNFRRIMCGFGTNCRIHEVIRPASEIVRRLKELQNTFGVTKSLPLFMKDGYDDGPPAEPAEPFIRKDHHRSITWHNDPGFFKYANNYPSKCK